VYEYNDEEKAIAKVDEIPSELEESAKEARDGCPVDAIDIKG
jgi:ferredoxin